MSEKIMKILRKQTKRVFCLIDGAILESLSPLSIKLLLEQIKQLGSIRKSIVFFDSQLAPEVYEMYLSRGFSPKIVPSDKDVNITLESLDVANSQQVDIICIGVKDDSLLPVVIKLRETIDILLISPTKTIAKSYLPYSDYIISLDEL
ncbi:MAG: NYN domain-containing protein [Asgard group archaeon]|nr:NYN domain-containing protein [Asgard group archaeon]